MDWKIFGTTFITIFIAEVGDKTQFAAMALAAESKSLTAVIAGTLLALMTAGLIGILVGNQLGQFFSPKTMKYAAGCLFLVIGVWTLAKA